MSKGIGLPPGWEHRIKALRKIAANAQDSFVGRHWPDMTAMRRDGIGFWLNDGEKELAIRRYLYEFQPEFVLQLLDNLLDQPATDGIAGKEADTKLDVIRLGRALNAVLEPIFTKAGVIPASPGSTSLASQVALYYGQPTRSQAEEE